MGDGGDLEDRRVPFGRQIADELAERPLAHGLVRQHAAFEHDLGIGRNQQILRDRLHDRQRAAAEAAGDGELVGMLGHLRAHGGGGVLQREVGADADDHRQGHVHPLRALERGAQVPAVVELHGGAVRPEQLQAMIGGVVDAGLRVAHDDDARRDEAAGILGRMKQDRQQGAEIEAVRMHVLLRRGLVDHTGGSGAAIPRPTASRISAKPTPNAASQFAWQHSRLPTTGTSWPCTLVNSMAGPPSRFFKRARDLQLRIDRRRVGL